jgi:Fic family protein
MTAFLKWFEAKDAIDPVLKAGLAHFWFVTIHPFEDGNGRIARAIADMTLARSEHSSQRFYSMSAQIRQEHKKYYDILESTQKGTMDVTAWMLWFLDCMGRAIDGAHVTLRAVLAQSAILGSHQRCAAQRPAANRDQPLAGRVRGQAHELELREPDEVLAGHRLSRYSGAGRAAYPRSEPRRWAQHELFARPIAIIAGLKHRATPTRLEARGFRQ